MVDLNPQREQMADESMVRNLRAQVECIWPQERMLLERYALSGTVRILDAGCGTGEATALLAEHYPDATLLGIDILDHHLATARVRNAAHGARVAFEHRSIFETALPDATFDLTVCRHVVQSVPHADRVFAELKRVTRPGGWLHVIAEDYDMLHFRRGTPDPRDFWHAVPAAFTARDHNDLFIGRHAAPLFAQLGLTDVHVDFVVVDTLRAPRDSFARVLEAWRDGYAAASAEVTGMSLAQSTAHFEAMIANIKDPEGYALWQVPVVSGRVPA